MIYTSNYNNLEFIKNPISISGDRGKQAGYQGKYYSKLAPKKDMWVKWHNNIGKVSESTNNRFYIREYLKTVLINLDAFETLKELDNYTLLCYEKNNEFCHRHIVAFWLEDNLAMKVPEIAFENNKQIVLPRPDYIKEIYETEKIILKK